MLYQAIYDGKGYIRSIQDAKSWIKMDGYYRTPCGFKMVAGSPCGCQGKYPGETQWVAPAMDEVEKLHYIQWQACSGNIIGYKFDHITKTVEVVVSSDRHGIPYNTIHKEVPTAVVEYKTLQRAWQWYETLDDHPEDQK